MHDDERLIQFLQSASIEELIELLNNVNENTYMHKMLKEKIDLLI